MRYNNPINKLSIPISVKSIGHKSFALVNRVGGASIPYKCNILTLPNYIDLNNCMKIGLSEESVSAFKINNTPEKVIKRKGGYTSVVEMKNGNNVYYKVSKDGVYGLTESKGTQIIQPKMDALEPAGSGYFRIKNGGYYGIMNHQGKTIIPINNHYTSIGDFNTNKGTFAFTKKGFSGVCDAQGREISTTRLALTADDIKTNGSYASAVEMKNGSTKYYKVSKGGRYGLTDSEGKEIVPCEMEALESAGTGYLKYKINGFWGVMNYAGKIIIDTNRGYTSIGEFKTFNKRFPYTMAGYKGECDINGRQISKIKVVTPKTNVPSGSSTSKTSSGNFEDFTYYSYYLIENGSLNIGGKKETCDKVRFDFGPNGQKIIVSLMDKEKTIESMTIIPSESTLIVQSGMVVISFRENGRTKKVSLIQSQDGKSEEIITWIEDNKRGKFFGGQLGKGGKQSNLGVLLDFINGYQGQNFNAQYKRVETELKKYSWKVKK